MEIGQKSIEKMMAWIYPPSCKMCGAPLPAHSFWGCWSCLWELSYVFQAMPFPAFNEKIQGDAWVNATFALGPGRLGTPIHQLVHQIKYHGHCWAAYGIGAYYGKLLGKHIQWSPLDLILPVPLHPNRQKTRGYNQSAWLAKGLSSSLGVPWNDKILCRLIDTPTQTDKNRAQRLANVVGAFGLRSLEAWQGKKVLLVDDLVTTGATLQACSETLLAAGIEEVVVAVLGLSSLD